MTSTAFRLVSATLCASALGVALSISTYGCGTSAATSDAGTTPDAGATSDSGSDAGLVAPVDAALAEGGPACSPVARAFKGSFPQPIPIRNACQSDLIHPILDCFFTTPYDPVACDDLVSPTGPQAACLACLFSSDGGPPGPIEWHGQSAEINVAGCVQAVLPQSGGCAQGLADVSACTLAACDQCVDRGANVLAECRTAALSTACAPTVDESASCVRALGPDGGAKGCDPSGSFIQAASTVGITFCGGYRDAGTD